MKSLFSASKSITMALATGSLLVLAASHSKADTAEASDRAYQMAMKYSGMGYYMTPSKEGHAGFVDSFRPELTELGQSDLAGVRNQAQALLRNDKAHRAKTLP